MDNSLSLVGDTFFDSLNDIKLDIFPISNLPKDLCERVVLFITQSSSFTKDYYNLSLVTKTWRILVREEHVWQAHFEYMSFPIPQNLDCALRFYYGSIKKSLLAHNVKNAMINTAQEAPLVDSPEMMTLYKKNIPCKFDFSDMPVFFIEKRMIVGYDNDKIYLYNFEYEKSEPKIISFDQDINSVCSIGSMIYCCLISGEIKCFACGTPDQIFSFGCHYGANDDPENNIMILASEAFILSISDGSIKGWCRSSGDQSFVYKNLLIDLDIGENFQIDDNKLYWTSRFLTCTQLFTFDLLSRKLLKSIVFDRELTKISISGNKGICFARSDLFHKYSNFLTFTLDSFELKNLRVIRNVYPTVSIPTMISFEGMIVCVAESDRQDKLMFIDSNTGKRLQTLNSGKIHGDDHYKYVSIEEESIFIAKQDNSIDFLTFAEEEVDEEEDMQLD